MIRRIEDWLLVKIQRNCQHPDDMVAVDILEGACDPVQVSYCRRCGAVRLNGQWRLPDPHLWKG